MFVIWLRPKVKHDSLTDLDVISAGVVCRGKLSINASLIGNNYLMGSLAAFWLFTKNIDDIFSNLMRNSLSLYIGYAIPCYAKYNVIFKYNFLENSLKKRTPWFRHHSGYNDTYPLHAYHHSRCVHHWNKTINPLHFAECHANMRMYCGNSFHMLHKKGLKCILQCRSYISRL